MAPPTVIENKSLDHLRNLNLNGVQRRRRQRPTVSDDAQDGQVHQALPVGPLLQGDAVARGGKDVAAADGDQLAAVVSARHVVQHRRVVDERVQLPARGAHVLDSQAGTGFQPARDESEGLSCR